MSEQRCDSSLVISELPVERGARGKRKDSRSPERRLDLSARFIFAAYSTIFIALRCWTMGTKPGTIGRFKKICCGDFDERRARGVLPRLSGLI